MATSAPERRSITRFDDQTVVALAALSAVAAGFAPGAATGQAGVDAIYRAAAAGAVVVLTARARRWTWLLLAGVAAACSHGAWVLPGAASLVVALGAGVRPVRLRMLGALVAALAVPVLLHQQAYGPQGLPLLVGGAAVLPAMASGYRRCQGRTRRRIRQVGWSVAGATSVAVVVAGLALVVAAGPLRRGGDGARRALADARAGRSEEARGGLDESGADLRRAADDLDAPWVWPARLVPGVAQQLGAVRTVAESGAALSRAGASLAGAGAYQDLKYRDGRIDLESVRQLAKPLRSAALVLHEEADRLAGVDDEWLVGPLRHRLDDARLQLGRAGDDADLAATTVDVLPGLLGGDGDRHYLVAFLNPAEERGLGGFVGNYGELVAADGKVRLTRSGSSAEIEAAMAPGVRTLDGPAEYLARHGTAQSADRLRDASSSPHFPYSADVMEQIYEQTTGVHLDGVIAMDARTVAALLALTGPIRVPGRATALTSENATDVIVREQYLDYADRNDARKDLLETATRLAFEKLLGGDLPAPAKVALVLGPMVRERRLLLQATRSDEQRYFERIGADGALPRATDGETLVVAHQNFGNNKIDAYLRRSIDYDTVIDARSGRVAATVTIRLENEAPSSGLPDYVIGNSRGAPPGTNMAQLLVGSHLQTVKVQVEGADRSFETGPERGLHEAQVRVDVPPGATVVVVVDLVGAADLSKAPYVLRFVPQPMVNADHLTASIRVRHGSAEPEASGALARRGPALVLTDRTLTAPIEVAATVTAEP